MGTSIYKGEAARKIPVMPGLQPSTAMQVFIGHVLDISYEDPVPGIIRVKIISVDKKSEDQITRLAFPADMNMVKYPLPGELVVMFNGIGSDTIKNRNGTQLYYITNFTSNSSITFNSNPFYSTIETVKTQEVLNDGAFQTRFESKLKNYQSFKSLGSPTILERPKVNPVEGDTILQGRFGSSIRLGSSGNSLTGVGWPSKRDTSGDPIVIFSVNKETGTLTRTEDVNLDDSSIYVCASQVIPVVLSTSKKLKTHAYLYNVEKDTTEPDPLPFLATPEDETTREEFNNINGYDREGVGVSSADLASLQLTGAAAYSYKLLLEREGTSLTPGWDINNWRIGHGSDTITLESGLVVKLPKNKSQWPNKWQNKDKGTLGYTNIGNSVDKDGQDHNDSKRKLWKWWMANPSYPETPLITEEDAHRDLARRIKTEFLPGVISAIKSVGGTQQAIDNIGPGALAALVSLKYNYGNIHAKKTWGSQTPASVAAKGDKQALVDYIKKIPHGSARRHAREAQYANGEVSL